MTTKPILNFCIDRAALKQIDAFKFKHRFPNRAAAVRWLCAAALEAKLVPAVAKGA